MDNTQCNQHGPNGLRKSTISADETGLSVAVGYSAMEITRLGLMRSPWCWIISVPAVTTTLSMRELGKDRSDWGRKLTKIVNFCHLTYSFSLTKMLFGTLAINIVPVHPHSERSVHSLHLQASVFLIFPHLPAKFITNQALITVPHFGPSPWANLSTFQYPSMTSREFGYSATCIWLQIPLEFLVEISINLPLPSSQSNGS